MTLLLSFKKKKKIHLFKQLCNIRAYCLVSFDDLIRIMHHCIQRHNSMPLLIRVLYCQFNCLPACNSCPPVGAKPNCFRTDGRRSPCPGATRIRRKMGCCSTCWEWIGFANISSWSWWFRSTTEVTRGNERTSLTAPSFVLASQP